MGGGVEFTSQAIPADSEKSDPRQSVLERKVNERLKCFKRCSVARILT